MTLRLIAWCRLWVDIDSVLIHVNDLLLNLILVSRLRVNDIRNILSTHRIYLYKTTKYVKIKLRMRGKKLTTLFDLHGKTALITGASSGLGEQFARSLSGAGARVILAARY